MPDKDSLAKLLARARAAQTSPIGKNERLALHLQLCREWLAVAQGKLAEAKAKARNPATLADSRRFAGEFIAAINDFQSMISKLRDPLEFHELQNDFERLLDEARELSR